MWGGLKQQQNLPEISQQQQQERSQHQQKRYQNQQGNGQQHREEFQKHQKERQKQTPKYQQQQKERQLPQEEIKKHQERQQRRKQHKNEQLKQHQLQHQQQQKQQHQQQQQLDETHNTYEKIMPTTPKKRHSKTIPAKHYDNVKCSTTKYVHQFRDKTVGNFTCNFLFIGYFCFVNFIFNFTFFALGLSGKLLCYFSDCFKWIQGKIGFQIAHTSSISWPLS